MMKSEFENIKTAQEFVKCLKRYDREELGTVTNKEVMNTLKMFIPGLDLTAAD